MARLDQIVRHPIKAIGHEVLSETLLSPARWIEGDRQYAVTHARGHERFNGDWCPKMLFLRGVSEPNLMAARIATLADGRLRLSHPARPTLEIDPEDDADQAALLRWLEPIWDAENPAQALVRAGNAHLTDVPDPWISIGNLASHADLEARAGTQMSRFRWRANFWVDGWPAWSEAELLERTLRIGSTELRVRAQITRCRATEANPDTGQRDINTLGLLKDLGHQEFGLYAEVIKGGPVKTGDPVEIL